MVAEAQVGCFFCKVEIKARQRTREHVIPAWMLKHFGLEGYQIDPTSWQGQVVVSQRSPHPMAAFQLGGVCSACNNGWMSDLEQQAKPLLLALSSGRRLVAEISHSEQRLIARWATKTALVLSIASHRDPKLPTALCFELYRGFGLPRGVVVVAKQTPGLEEGIVPVTVFQSDSYPVIVPIGAGRTAPPSWKVSIRIQTLQLLVSYCSKNTWRHIGWQGVHVPLSPSSIDLWYRAGLRRDEIVHRRESGTVLFHVSLGLANGIRSDSAMIRPPIEEMVNGFYAHFDQAD